MKYDVDSIIECFPNVSDYSEKRRERSYARIRDYVEWEKPDYVALLVPNQQEFILYEKNYNFDFGSREEGLMSALECIPEDQLNLLFQVDMRIAQFVMEEISRPLDFQFNVRFNVELVQDQLLTVFRKLRTIELDENGRPEIGLVTINNITPYSKERKVVFEVKLLSDSFASDEKIVEKLKEDINRILSPTTPELTKREREILKAIGNGLTSAEVGDALSISKATVDTHRQNMIKKFDVPNVTTLIQIAKTEGII